MRYSSSFSRKGFGAVLLGALVLSAGFVAAGQQVNPVTSERLVDYNWDVKPILSDNCFPVPWSLRTSKRVYGWMIPNRQ